MCGVCVCVCVCVLPVICVGVSVARRGVNIICYQPVEVLVATDTDALHVLLGHVQAVCIEVAKNHHVLVRKVDRTSTLREECVNICASNR